MHTYTGTHTWNLNATLRRALVMGRPEVGRAVRAPGGYTGFSVLTLKGLGALPSPGTLGGGRTVDPHHAHPAAQRPSAAPQTHTRWGC